MIDPNKTLNRMLKMARDHVKKELQPPAPDVPPGPIERISEEHALFSILACDLIELNRYLADGGELPRVWQRTP